MRLLLIEDDTRIAENLSKILKVESFAVDCAYCGADGLNKACSEEYDIIILDWMLPDINGMEICKRLRGEGVKTMIIMLTAKSQLEDVVEGLNTGADDYLTKPFKTEELLARIRALLRRNMIVPLSPIITINELKLDTNSHRVWRSNKEIMLSPKEYAMLEFLMKNKNRVLERLDIFSHVWDENADIFSNMVDVYIRYLRKKIDVGFDTQLIKTVRGKGYMIMEVQNSKFKNKR